MFFLNNFLTVRNMDNGYETAGATYFSVFVGCVKGTWFPQLLSMKTLSDKRSLVPGAKSKTPPSP